MTDELAEISGESGPHVVWRPGTNGELVVAAPCGGLPFEVPYRHVWRTVFRQEPIAALFDEES
jgi:hypothetical protein